MKNILFVFILLFKYIEANNVIVIEDSLKKGIINGITGLGKEVIRQVRVITKTSTKKEECKLKWRKYFNNKENIANQYWRENQKMKQLLHKKYINYYPIVKQRTYNISIDTKAIIKNSCTEGQFNMLKNKMKYIKKLKIENRIYKEMMSLNNLEVPKSDYIKKSDSKKHIKALANLREQLNK